MSELLQDDAGQSFQPDLLGDAIRLWNNTLRWFAPGEEVPIEFREAIQAKLDKLWPYAEELCAFSGLCQTIESRSNDTATSYTSTKEDFVDIASGVSDGLWVTSFGKPGAEYWEIAWGFYERFVLPDGEAEIRRDHYVHTAAKYAVVPACEIDNAFENAEFPTLHGVLSQRSDEFALLLHDKDFFTLKAKEQKFVIDSALETANEESARLDGGICNRTIGLQGERGFMLLESNGSTEYCEIDIAGYAVKGDCQGLMVLARRQVAQGRKIKNADELVDVEAGFCLRVIPDEATEYALHLAKDQEIYIPISGQELDVSLNPATIEQM